MSAYPATWRIWGSKRYGLTRLPRYWLALLACRRHGHYWTIRSVIDGYRRDRCGRCHAARPHSWDTDCWCRNGTSICVCGTLTADEEHRIALTERPGDLEF